jgi:CheY-like chemotaxis protein
MSKRVLRVLIVDDDEEFAKDVLGYKFKQMGYDVRIASDLKSARKELDEREFSIATVDMCLGREGAIEGELVLDYIRDNYRQVPCIIISGSPIPPSRSFKMRSRYPMVPDTGYIEKNDFEYERLEELVNRLCPIEEGTMVSSNVEKGVQELKKLSYDLRSLSDRMAETEKEYRKGALDIARYNQLLRDYGTERYEIIDKMQTLMQGRGLDQLHEALEKVKNHEPEEAIKTELKEEAKKQGWGDKVFEEIEKHKGEIVSLIVSIAMELGKRAVAGM